MAVSKRLRFEIFRRDNHTCRYCGRSAPEVVLRPDHIVPVALGGRDDPSNLVTACDDCNSGKSATPPDAALVGQVAEDAVRWARARKAAAEKMLADLDARVAVRDEFLNAWNAWEIGGSNVELPAGWEATIDRFIAAGLPVPLLLDCIDVAWSRRLKPDSIFNYLCGVAWNRVRALDEAAAQSVGSTIPVTPANSPPGARDLVQEVRDFAGDERVDELIEEALEEGHPEAHLGAEVAMRFIDHLMDQFVSYRDAMIQIQEQLPADILAELSAKYDEEPDMDEATAHVFMARFIRTDYALRYLQELPQVEANDWITCASHFFTEEKAILRLAASLARDYKKDGRKPLYLCQMEGPNQTICPGTKTQRVFFVKCRNCEADCLGHVELCDEHVVKAIDGGVWWGGEDAGPAEVAEIKDFVKPDAWAF